MYRGLVPVEAAYQNLMPAFVGLFAIPWVLQNAFSRTQIPPQHVAASVDADLPLVLRGVLSGAAGGLFAAFFPVVTGGIGGFIAGHATAQRDDRLFIVSQGASKAIYYIGSLLLFFVPGLHLSSTHGYPREKAVKRVPMDQDGMREALAGMLDGEQPDVSGLKARWVGEADGGAAERVAELVMGLTEGNM